MINRRLAYNGKKYKYYKYVETAFTNPIMTANVAMGGSVFGAQASAENPSYPIFKIFDNIKTTSGDWRATTNGGQANVWIKFYNPVAVKMTSILFTCGNYSKGNLQTGKFLGSDDGNTWTQLCLINNTVIITDKTWTLTINSPTFYKYHMIDFDTTGGYGVTNMREAKLTGVVRDVIEVTATDAWDYRVEI